ncbi:MAG TPA: hypothetical protein VF834_09850 [Streptosporangiaceae bacterium]
MARRANNQVARADQLRQAAAAGDPDAMWYYALLLLGLQAPPASLGNPLPFLLKVAGSLNVSPLPEAREWVGRAVEAGNTSAMVVAAIQAESTDMARTRQLLSDAAGHGDTAAMLYLGSVLEHEDQAAARELYARLAALGDDGGMVRLGLLCRSDDPQGARAWFGKAAQTGNLRAQNELSVMDYEAGNRHLDRAHPPAIDPRKNGLFTPNSPLTRHDRIVAECIKCGRKTVQDIFEIIVGKWFGLRGSTTSGKTGQRVTYSGCATCGCLFPADDAARQYVQSKGGEFFNPAKLTQQN